MRILILACFISFTTATSSTSLMSSNSRGIGHENNSCQKYVQKGCNWSSPTTKISINLTNPCDFNCSYDPSLDKNEGPIRLIVKIMQNWKEGKPDAFISVQQNHEIHAYHLPIFFSDLKEDQPYTTLEKIFCPPRSDTKEDLYFRITSSKVDVSVNLKVTPNIIQLNKNITTDPSPISATVLLYQWEKGQESVLITATDIKSENGKQVCALFSLQKAQCPYYTDESTIIAGSVQYQSILGRGGMVARRSSFPDGIHIVVLPLPSNDLCLQVRHENQNRTSRSKRVTVAVHPHLTISESWSKFVGIGVFIAVVVGGTTVLAVTLISKIFNNFVKDQEEPLLESDVVRPLSISVVVDVINDEATIEDESTNQESPEESALPLPPSIAQPSIEDSPPSDNRSLMQTSQRISGEVHPNILRFTPSYNPRYVFWWRSMQMYTPKTPETELKTSGFRSNIVLMGLFMALPFMELLRSYINVFSNNGSEDQCHFNMRCITTWWIFNDFARVFSNIGYFLCGGGLLVIIHFHKRHTDAITRKQQDRSIVGVNHNYELFKGLAYTMIIQCVMSSMYHICPNEVTLRFDMLFIYIITILIIVCVWGLRHGSATEHIYSSLGLVGTMLVLAQLKEWVSAWLFWLTFGTLQCLLTAIISYCLVNYDTWSFSPYSSYEIMKKWNPILKKVKTALQEDSSTPMGTRVRVVLGVATNVVLVILGAALDLEIYKYILIVCLVHMCLYLMNYIFTKFHYREKPTALSLTSLGLAIMLWAAALAFFSMNNSDSELPPSFSRLLNAECILMGVFSYHDLWHLFSAFSLFLTFIGILTLDDHLFNVPSEKIRVF